MHPCDEHRDFDFVRPQRDAVELLARQIEAVGLFLRRQVKHRADVRRTRPHRALIADPELPEIHIAPDLGAVHALALAGPAGDATAPAQEHALVCRGTIDDEGAVLAGIGGVEAHGRGQLVGAAANFHDDVAAHVVRREIGPHGQARTFERCKRRGCAALVRIVTGRQWRDVKRFLHRGSHNGDRERQA